MTFEEWCERYEIDEDTPSFGILVMCWSAAVKSEREACAKVCEAHGAEAWDHEGGALACAEEIRKRGIDK